MPKRISSSSDPVLTAHRVFQASIEESSVSVTMIHRVMAEMGRKGGKIGGKRRLETLTDERRSQIASDAAKARWAAKKATPAKKATAKKRAK